MKTTVFTLRVGTEHEKEKTRFRRAIRRRLRAPIWFGWDRSLFEQRYVVGQLKPYRRRALDKASDRFSDIDTSIPLYEAITYLATGAAPESEVPF